MKTEIKAKVNANVVYLIGLLIYGVIVANKYSQINVVQALNEFAITSAKVLAVLTVPFLLAQGIFFIIMAILVKAFKEVKTSSTAKSLLEDSKDKWKDWDKLGELKTKKFSITTVAFWLLFVLTVVGGGTFTAIMMLFIAFIGKGLKRASIGAYDEYVRLLGLMELKTVGEEK